MSGGREEVSESPGGGPRDDARDDTRPRASIFQAALAVRHQLSAFAATSVDFGTMIAGVELLGLAPSTATLISTTIGGLTNFVLARGWAFRRIHSGGAGSQAIRYALVSLGGGVLNACAVAALLDVVTIPYPLARALVAIAIGVFYNYPLHARFVFRVTRDAEGAR